MTLLDSIDEAAIRSILADESGEQISLSEEAFRKMLTIERKRTERSGKPFLLMLLDVGTQHMYSRSEQALVKIMSTLTSSIRETDVIGWYKDRIVIGVMFTGLIDDDRNGILNALLGRIRALLQDALTSDQFNQLNISFHFFPDTWDHDKPGRPSDEVLYPDTAGKKKDSDKYVGMKRVVDVVGSLIALVLSFPLLVFIALAIKISSKGPILFKQQRVGQHGQCFLFLKFRSMHVNNDPSRHRQYVQQMIAGHAAANASTLKGSQIYKLTDDKRVTRIGRVLRNTSLDELPQFINVLLGDMSLVGPRPAIPYEVAAYQTWHRRRVLDVKPGITGLWQVNGRNRLKFDEMVRLDLQYAKSCSPWLDLKILLLTPRAVFKGAC